MGSYAHLNLFQHPAMGLRFHSLADRVKQVCDLGSLLLRRLIRHLDRRTLE
jgi:hypothetical protein